MFGSLPLWAQVTETAADLTTRDTYKFAKLMPYEEARWFYVAVVVISVALVAFVITMYRRDATELRPGLGILLLGLRLIALAGVLFFFMDLEKRTEREIVHNSRVLLLVDTSQSMGMHDSDSSPVPATPSRIDQVVDQLAEGSLLEDLRKVHDVVIFRFDQDSDRVVSMEKREVQGNSTVAAGAESDQAEAGDKEKETEEKVDWKKTLIPQGAETRLGGALKRLIDQERSNPISAMIVLTDGGHNSGVEPSVAAEAAQEANIPVYTVGLGSDNRPVNVRVSDFLAPSRAYPGDAFTATAYVQAQGGLAEHRVTVKLFSRDASDKNGPGALEESRRITLGADGEVTPVKFELDSEATGRRTYRLQLEDLPKDYNASDNHQEVDIEIVDRETRVLLMAGGASREYRFLRNQLRRDKDVIVDVLIQSARPGISQDADEILDDFPATKDELYQYDAIVSFDADWNDLDAHQMSLLEKWVGEESGGLILLAGPVQMGSPTSWIQNPSAVPIRNLCPVEFHRRFASLSDDEFGSDTPWPIDFTREGFEAEFLWIEESSAENQVAWETFPGVYGFYDVKGPKPGATVYSRFSNPETSLGDELPVYMAGHFYGSGRVFYMGSGEIWRTRAEDEAYFERFYTKLIRHVSEGRLIRGSTKGVLLVERDRYLMGDTVVVRAQLSDSQHDPLEIPSVSLQATRPDSTTMTLVLKADASRKGMYNGQFTALQEGVYRMDLPVPETIDELLTRRIQVKVPDLERENPQRNDKLLQEIAQATGGRYFVGLAAAVGDGQTKPLVSLLRNRQETTTLAGSPDQEFEKQLMITLLSIICGALFFEWLIRRLCKLA